MLQISDIHYGFDSDQSSDDKEFAKEIAEIHIREQVVAMCLKERPASLVVVLNGDFAIPKMGDKKNQIISSYNRFIKPLNDSLRRLQEDLEEIKIIRVAVPGNHDIERDKGGATLIKPNAFSYSEACVRCFYDAIAEINSHLCGEKATDERIYTPRDKPSTIVINQHELLLLPLDSAYGCGALKPLESVSTRGERGESDEGMTRANTLESARTRGESRGLSSSASHPENERVHIFEKLDRYDPVTIDETELLECEKSILEQDSAPKQIRIAIVHHNPINPTLRKDSYICTNDNKFWDFLSRMKFDYLLHGHSHQTTVLHIEVIRKIGGITQDSEDVESSADFVGPHIESGVSTIGVRSLWPANIGVRGFNLITISEIEGTGLSRVLVNEVKIDPDKIAGSRKNVITKDLIQFTRATQQITSFKDPKRRMATLHRLNSKIYSTLPVTEFDREASLPPRAEKQLNTEKQGYVRFSPLVASYAIAVIGPGDWLNSGFRDALNPFASINLIRASQFSQTLDRRRSEHEKQFGYTLPVFRVSRWLYEAIFACCKKGEDWGVNEKLDVLRRTRPHRLSLSENEFFKRAEKRISRISLADAKSSSLSYFALNYQEEDGRNFRALDRDFSVLKQDLCIEDESLFSLEMPRIVLWTQEELLRPSSMEVIRFHEEHGIPLFHIYPEKLLSATNRNQRSAIGRTSLYGIKKGKLDRHDFTNGKSGAAPRRADMLDLGVASDGEMLMKIWGARVDSDTHDAPDSIIGELPIHEFKYLSLFSETMFACDAWVLACLNVR